MKNGRPGGYDCCYHTTTHSHQKGRRTVKISKTAVHWKGPAMPEVQFEEDQQLTSFAGLLIFAQLFERLNLRDRLRECFGHLKINSIYGHGTVVMVLIVHLLLGYRKLQDMRYYCDDPMVKRALSLKQLPDVATVSRILSTTDKTSVAHMRGMLRACVSDRLVKIAPARVTADFDGSVYGTSRKAQGTAVGYNKKKKGQRSYYPLFCSATRRVRVMCDRRSVNPTIPLVVAYSDMRHRRYEARRTVYRMPRRGDQQAARGVDHWQLRPV